MDGKLNGKVVTAFIAGAVVASGIVYMAVKPDPETPVARETAGESIPQPATSAPAPAAVTSPAASPVTSPAASVKTPERSTPPIRRAPVREKPSPMPPRRERPIIFARNQDAPLTPIDTPVLQTKPAATAPITPAAPEPPTPAPPLAPTPVPSARPAAAGPVPTPTVPALAPTPTAPEFQERVPHSVTLAAGTMLPVRIGETISSAHSQPGDSFLATLAQPLIIDGFIIAEKGSRAEGRVVEVDPAGRVRGVSHLGVELVRLSTSDGQNIRIRTEPYRKDGPTSTGTDAAKIGGGAAVGAIIGAIAGGGKGAAIGGGAGGALGAGDVLLTRGKPVEIPVETRLTFRVQESVTITEKLN